MITFTWAEITDATGYTIQVFETENSLIDIYTASKTAGALGNGANTGITVVTLNTAASTTTFQFTAPEGGKYFIRVVAYDDAGNESASWAQSDTILVDITNPTSAATVLDTANGVSYPGDYYNNSTVAVTFSWSGFADAGIGIDHYEVQSCDGMVAAVPTACDVGNDAHWSATAQDVGLVSSVSTNGYETETFEDGETVALRVRAVDEAGNQSAWIASDGIVIDNTAPDASGSTPALTDETTARQGSVAWADATDTGGSGIDYYVVEVTHSTDRVAYFTCEVDSGKTTVSNLIEYPNTLETTVVDDIGVAAPPDTNLVMSGGDLFFTYDDAGSASDYTTVIIRVYDRAGNESQTFISAEVNVQ